MPKIINHCADGGAYGGYNTITASISQSRSLEGKL
jgi:hypothetical protein